MIICFSITGGPLIYLFKFLILYFKLDPGEDHPIAFLIVFARGLIIFDVSDGRFVYSLTIFFNLLINSSF